MRIPSANKIMMGILLTAATFGVYNMVNKTVFKGSLPDLANIGK
ncbi:MAG: hypothetical protein ACE5ES_01815 [Candidatus Nanoarchaeia archaeon]